VVCNAIFDQVDGFGGRDLVVGLVDATDGVGVDDAILLRNVEPPVGSKLERGWVVDIRTLQSTCAEVDRFVLGAQGRGAAMLHKQE